MFKLKLAHYVIIFIFAIFSLILVCSNAYASLNLKDAFSDTLLEGFGTAAGYNTAAKNSPESIIATIIQAFLSLLGVIFLGLMVYGGYLWMTAAGKDEKMTKAKDLITAAVIGLIIVVSSYAISVFVVSKMGTTTLTDKSESAGSASH